MCERVFGHCGDDSMALEINFCFLAARAFEAAARRCRGILAILIRGDSDTVPRHTVSSGSPKMYIKAQIDRFYCKQSNTKKKNRPPANLAACSKVVVTK
jgi:hypothetical protein